MTERRLRRVVAENREPINGAMPWADVIEDLTWGEIKALRERAPMDSASFDVAGTAIARYVVGWNIEGRSAESGELEPVAPPAEAGAAAFDCVEPWVISWLFITMHQIHLLGGDELRKKPTPSSGTPDGQNATGSDSTRPESRRKSRMTTS